MNPRETADFLTFIFSSYRHLINLKKSNSKSKILLLSTISLSTNRHSGITYIYTLSNITLPINNYDWLEKRAISQTFPNEQGVLCMFHKIFWKRVPSEGHFNIITSPYWRLHTNYLIQQSWKLFSVLITVFHFTSPKIKLS